MNNQNSERSQPIEEKNDEKPNSGDPSPDISNANTPAVNIPKMTDPLNKSGTKKGDEI